MLENLLRALELDGLWNALSTCLTVVSILEVKLLLKKVVCFSLPCSLTSCRVSPFALRKDFVIVLSMVTASVSVGVLFWVRPSDLST